MKILTLVYLVGLISAIVNACTASDDHGMVGWIVSSMLFSSLIMDSITDKK